MSRNVRALDRIAVLLERVVPWIARVERPARMLAIAGITAAVWLMLLVLRDTDLGSVVDWIAFLVSLAILSVPVGVLVLFVLALRQLMELPEQLRTLPQTTLDQAAHLGAAINTLRQPRRSGARGSVIGLWRVRGALFELAGLVEPFMSITGLVRLPFLLLVGLAALIVLIEILIALIAFVVVAVP
jgi:hypothetical protein